MRLLAVYEARPAEREGVLAALRAMLDAPATASCPTLQLVAGLVFLKVGICGCIRGGVELGVGWVGLE